jgi:SAM-dependent methyltransferase
MAALTAEKPPMKQTPAHSVVNRDLLGLMPAGARRVVEVGCMHGALAREYRAANPGVHYTGIDIDPEYAQVAQTACDVALAGDIERFDAAAFASLFPSDCWVFGDCLEHLRDPWRILRQIRQGIDSDGCLLTCIPNAQHWSVQMRLATGLFRYEDSGLLDRTHIRWFTRTTMIEMFAQAGWRIESGLSRRLPQQPPAALMDGIRAIAAAAGADAEQAVEDASVFQYLFKLRPD